MYLPLGPPDGSTSLYPFVLNKFSTSKLLKTWVHLFYFFSEGLCLINNNNNNNNYNNNNYNNNTGKLNLFIEVNSYQCSSIVLHQSLFHSYIRVWPLSLGLQISELYAMRITLGHETLGTTVLQDENLPTCAQLGLESLSTISWSSNIDSFTNSHTNSAT